MAYRPKPLAERFWPKVEKRGPDECWPWLGHKSRKGYGTVWSGTRGVRASHASVFLATGRWPLEGMVVCHHCDNPPCVNPAHLYVGTAKDNVRDRIERRGQPVWLKDYQVRGEQCWAAKLSAEAVLEIRRSAAPNRALADKYGVHIGTIRRARAGVQWAHVGEAA